MRLAVETFSNKLEENISSVAIHTVELVWTRTVVITKFELCFCHRTENFCLDSIKSHKRSEPRPSTGTNTCKVSKHGNFCWTSGLSSWPSDLLNSLAQCLVSKKISVEHCRRKNFPVKQFAYSSWFHLSFKHFDVILRWSSAIRILHVNQCLINAALSRKSPHGELTIKFVLYCKVPSIFGGKPASSITLKKTRNWSIGFLIVLC